MGNSTLPTVLDKLCMVTNIHTTRKQIEVLKDEISKRQVKIESIQNKIKALEQSMEEHENKMNNYSDLPK